MTRAAIAALVGMLLLGFLASAAAAGGKPTIVRIELDETFADEFLTDLCGVPVTTHVEGHFIARTFPDGAGVASVNSINVAVTATAGDNSYSFRDVGADVVQIKPDGSEILLVIGQIPFGWTGVLKIDLASGEPILEPQHSLEGDLDEACAALTA